MSREPLFFNAAYYQAEIFIWANEIWERIIGNEGLKKNAKRA